MLGNLIFRYLSRASGGQKFVLFREPLGSRGDPYLAEVKTPTLFLSDEVFYYLSAREADKKPVEEAIREVNPYPSFVGVLSAVDDVEKDLVAGSDIDEAVLKSFIRGLEYLIVGAYDADGFVVWAGDELKLQRLGSCGESRR